MVEVDWSSQNHGPRIMLQIITTLDQLFYYDCLVRGRKEEQRVTVQEISRSSWPPKKSPLTDEFKWEVIIFCGFAGPPGFHPSNSHENNQCHSILVECKLLDKFVPFENDIIFGCKSSDSNLAGELVIRISRFMDENEWTRILLECGWWTHVEQFNRLNCHGQLCN